MTRIILEIYDDLVITINKIRAIQDSGIEVEIPQGSVLFDNVLNLKLLQKEADKMDIVLHLVTSDEVGNRLIETLKDGGTQEMNVETMQQIFEEHETKQEVSKKFSSINLKKFIPSFRIAIPNMFKVGIILPLVVLGIVIILLGARVNKQKALIKIVVNSQPLARSITIKVKSGIEKDDINNKILKGTQLTALTENTMETTTSGEKLIGEKSEGKALIYNRTSTEKEFKKGTILTYDDKDLSYVLNDTITVPGAAPEDPLVIGSPSIPGNKEVEISAEKIGASYNIDKDKGLEVKGQKKADFEAKTSTDITGGKSETIKVVAEKDQTSLKNLIIPKAEEESTKMLKQKVSNSQALIEGSTTIKALSESYSHKIGDETEKLTLVQKTDATGLIYSKKDLDNLIDKLVENLVPEGYIISTKDREVNIEVLGNSTDSVLSNTEADLQITFKTFIDPKIEQEELKENLKGKSPEQAQKILGELKNINSYSLDVTNRVPFFNKLPTNKDKIEITIERE